MKYLVILEEFSGIECDSREEADYVAEFFLLAGYRNVRVEEMGL